VNDFLDKTTEARFKRDAMGRLIFFPFGFGSGRIVPDSATEAELRRGCRRFTIALFAVVIPIMSVMSALFQLKGVDYLVFFGGCVLVGFASQIYPIWLSRGLAQSEVRLSFSGAALASLNRFGEKFLYFGLAVSGVTTATAVFLLAYEPVRAVADPVATTIALLVFAPLTLAYALALRRKRDANPSQFGRP
jgi:ABC-type Fe3+ transport system permease subunit